MAKGGRAGRRPKAKRVGKPNARPNARPNAKTVTQPDNWCVDVLGTTHLRRLGDDTSLKLSPAQRRLLAGLAMRRGRYVPVDVLIDAIWANEAPKSAKASLHNMVSRLRDLAGEQLISYHADGYRLEANTDAAMFERDVARAIELGERDEVAAAGALDSALESWQGAPFHDVEHLPEVATVVASLGEVRRAAEVARVRTWLKIGQCDRAIAEAERLVSSTPADETRWVLLVDALRAAGRRGDALSAVARATRHLRDDLGISPSDELREMHSVLVAEPVDPGALAQRHPTGREATVSRLVSLIEMGTSVAVVGEDGIGKSTVAREVWRVLRRRGRRAVMVTADQNVASATALLDDVMVELGLPQLVGLDAVDAFVRSVVAEASSDHLVIVVDDIGFVGPSTVTALEQCVRDSQVQLLVTARLSDGVPDQFSALRTEILEPLPDDAVKAILRESEMARGQLGTARQRALVELAGGNPLLLAHLIHESYSTKEESFSTKEIDDDFDPPHRAVSDGLASTVARMLSAHPVAVRRAIDVASIIGRTGSMAILEELSSASAVSGALASGLIAQRGDEFVFRHGAVAQVCVASVPGGLRDDVRRSFADAARRRMLPTLLYANHSYLAAALSPLAAYTDCMLAGNEVSQHGLYRDAAEWFDRARNVARRFLAGEPQQALRARVRAGNARRLLGDPSHVPELLACVEEALRLGQHQLIAEATYALLQFGGTSQRSNVQQQALRLARRAMQALRGTEQWALIAAATTLVLSLFDDPSQPRQNFLKALDVAKQSELRMRILPYAYMTFGHPRDLNRRIASATELLRLARHANDAPAMFSAHHQHWANALVLGDADALAHHYEAMTLLAERIGTVGARWEVLCGHAALLIARGELQFAERVAHEAHDLLAPVMAERAATVLMSQLFAIRRCEGRLTQLSTPLASVIARQPSVGALRALHAATLESIDPARAVHEALAASATLHDDFTWLPAQFVVGEVLVNSGRTEGAAAVLASLEPWQHLHAAPLTCSFGPVRDVVHNLRELLAPTR